MVEKPSEECDSCVIERIGCGCDGALDDGCFLCTPEKHERPPCPPTCKNYRPTVYDRLNAD